MPLHSWLNLVKFRRLSRKNEYNLGVFVDLSKAFNVVSHSTLLRKLDLYGITDRNYAGIKSYLSNHLQYIQDDQNFRTEYWLAKCWVPQGSILVSLLFLLYIDYLKDASSVLDPIMFVDDTNLFCTQSRPGGAGAKVRFFSAPLFPSLDTIFDLILYF